MAAKEKSVGGGKPKATKTYDGTSVKRKESATKTKGNDGGKRTAPDPTNSIIEKKKNIIKSYFETRNINYMDPTAVE